MTKTEKQTYRFLTYFFGTILICHILFAGFLIFNPNKNNLTTHRWEKAYRLFGLTGPFFSEERINVIPRVSCSIKAHGDQWDKFNELGREELNAYHQGYFNYSQLLLSGFPRYLCRQIHIQEDSIVQSNYLESLKQYIQLRNPSVKIDSVQIVYSLESLAEVHSDTFFVKKLGGFEQDKQQ